MLFSDPIYFLFLLPMTATIYWLLINKRKFRLVVPVLIVASVIFYVTWSWKFFLLLFTSAVFNFLIGRKLLDSAKGKFWLYLGVLGNLALLGYFKYFNFFIEICNNFLKGGVHWQTAQIVLPLGISFYTFQQIAYIVDAYRKQVERCGFWEYILFVIYFPQLVAGPIVHYQEMLPQFHAQKAVNWETLWKGIFLFICGLFKKVLIADSLAPMVQQGYADVNGLGIFSAWLLSLGYTFQLYFDFSGYADMAIGSGLLFGIKLPENFNSPYKALDIQDFWRRWHMSLSTWLKNYVYFPLGGSRCSIFRICINLFLTFFIGGIWHGAGWTFIAWGTLHGLAALIHRLWIKTGFHLNKFVAWFITFNFVNIAWVIFRANSIQDACLVITKLVDLSVFRQIDPCMTLKNLRILLFGNLSVMLLLKWGMGCFVLCFLFPNVRKLYGRFGRPHMLKTFILAGVFFYVFLKTGSKVDFLYWQF